jgi:anion-transporting  ArsA/GET3 family ATPase
VAADLAPVPLPLTGHETGPRPEQVALEDLLRRRVVLITGKGGVGRSSVTAAIANVAARRRKRVLVTEIGEVGGEQSHLARIFGRERLPDALDSIAPGIQGALLRSHRGQELFLSAVLHIPALARFALASDALRRLMQAAPSFREMGIFYHLLTFLKEVNSEGGPAHELILIDMPATGHTLALTGLPEILLALVSRGPIANALREGQSYLNDPTKGAAYVVTLPETLPVSESLELIDGLRKTKMPVGGVILNRMPEDPFTSTEREALGPLLESRALFGADGFRRVPECRKAVERLSREISVPLLMIPDQPRGPGLVPAMADALEAGGGWRPTADARREP